MPNSRAAFTAIELLIAMTILTVVATLALPSLFTLSSHWRVRLAAGELVGALRSCRMEAIRRNHNVALRFDRGPNGAYRYTLYGDGDGDGVLSGDIRAGRDPRLGPARELQMLGADVRFGIPAELRPRDPGDPRRRLDRLDDPVRFNRSDLASFGPLGTSTAGSLYLTDGNRVLMVVRVFGTTGKVKVMVYDPETERWLE